MSAVRFAGCAAIAAAASPLAASAGHAGLAVALGAVAVGLGLLSRRALRLARRSRVGAESEAQVRRALKPLAREGWRVAHAVDWPGRGDLDHVVRSPSGMGFVIETKTLRYTRAHLARTVDSARWLARRRRRYPAGVCPVICVTRARPTEHIEDEVLVVSLDRLMPALRRTRHLPSAMVDRRDDRASARRLTTGQRGVDDCIEESGINRPLAVVSGRAIAAG